MEGKSKKKTNHRPPPSPLPPEVNTHSTSGCASTVAYSHILYTNRSRLQLPATSRTRVLPSFLIVSPLIFSLFSQGPLCCPEARWTSLLCFFCVLFWIREPRTPAQPTEEGKNRHTIPCYSPRDFFVALLCNPPLSLVVDANLVCAFLFSSTSSFLSLSLTFPPYSSRCRSHRPGSARARRRSTDGRHRIVE